MHWRWNERWQFVFDLVIVAFKFTLVIFLINANQCFVTLQSVTTSTKQTDRRTYKYLFLSTTHELATEDNNNITLSQFQINVMTCQLLRMFVTSDRYEKKTVLTFLESLWNKCGVYYDALSCVHRPSLVTGRPMPSQPDPVNKPTHPSGLNSLSNITISVITSFTIITVHCFCSIFSSFIC